MPTIQVAAQGAFPEKLMKLVLLNALLQHLLIEFEHYFFIKTKAFTPCPSQRLQGTNPQRKDYLFQEVIPGSTPSVPF
jgi:hypothetical protein